MTPLPQNGHPRDDKAAPRGAARGRSLHIGLNHVDSDHYRDQNGAPWGGPGMDGELFGCVNDAHDMQALAVAQGFQTQLMTDEHATSAEVIRAVGMAANDLSPGDLFVLSYSGHGGQLTDANGDDEDGLDETWCLYDRELVDDELFNLWSQFAPGVRIFMLSDSCHSGTVLRAQAPSGDRPPALSLRARYERLDVREVADRASRVRSLPVGVRAGTYQAHKELYDTVQWSAGRRERAKVEAKVLLISGCQDNQLSYDGDANGLFTETLLRVWDGGAFEGDYGDFRDAIAAEMPENQTPRFETEGPANPVFEAQKPFTIGEAAGGGAGPAPAPSTASPSIVADETSYDRGGPAPTFTVDPGANPYYVVEVASDYALFAGRPDGNTAAFYATYYDQETPARESGSSFALPDAAWEALRSADRLYYRIGTTPTEDSWLPYIVSTEDGAEPPSLEVVASEERVPPRPTRTASTRPRTTAAKPRGAAPPAPADPEEPFWVSTPEPSAGAMSTGRARKGHAADAV